MRVDKYTSVIEAIELAVIHCTHEVAKKKLKEALLIILRIRNDEWIVQKVKDIIGNNDETTKV